MKASKFWCVIGVTIILAVVSILVVSPTAKADKPGEPSIVPLLNEVEYLEVEWEKYQRGNKSAGERATRILTEIRHVSQELKVCIDQDIHGND